MNQQERKERLEQLRREYKDGIRSREAITLEAKVLKVAIDLYEKRHPESKLL